MWQGSKKMSAFCSQESLKITKQHLLYWRLKNQFLISKSCRNEVISELMGLQAQFANNPKHALQICTTIMMSRHGIKIWSKHGVSGIHCMSFYRNKLRVICINAGFSGREIKVTFSPEVGFLMKCSNADLSHIILE